VTKPARPARSRAALAGLVAVLAGPGGAARADAGPDRVIVDSATTCPSAAEIEERLRVLLPPLADGAAPERASLVAEDGALRVRLRAADGTPLAERTVTVAASCADRANVVAVVIAAWDVQQRAEHVDDPSLPRAARATPPPAPNVVVASPAPAPTSLGPRLELTLAPALTFVDGGATPSGTLAVSLWGRRLGARAGLFGLLPRTDGLGGGQARWTRVGVTLEAALRVSGRLGRLDGHAGFIAGAVVADGSGFDLDHETSGFSPGAIAGVDWSYLFGRVFAGAGASLSAWTAQRLVFDAGAPVARALPRLQPAVDLDVGVVF
jgi:hypothetical protein